MGRQIRFFMLGDDEKRFMDFVREKGDIIIDKKGSSLSLENIIDKSQRQVFIKSEHSRIVKWSRCFIDPSHSDVIEFLRNITRNPKIVEYGRLWAEFIDYDEEEQPFRKEKWFEDKYDTYKRWIVKNSRISKDKQFYIGTNTYWLYKHEGYHMMAGPKVEEEFE